MTKELQDKVAIVTGASKGIGASIAQHLAAEGAAVVVNYANSKEGADHVVGEIIKSGGKAVAVKANVAEPKEVKYLFDETKKAFGRLDILVNNAGIYETCPLEKITPEFIYKTFDINVVGLLLACKEAIKHFDSTGGSIINISSVASVTSAPEFTVYCASKAAVDAITRTLSSELGPHQIRVNAVNPGMVETEGLHTSGIADSALRREVEAKIPLGRLGQPEDIAPAVVFLASDKSSWISGVTFFIAGGPL